MKIRQEKGFTIIEVMIVLAIAGLIMGIIFLAVPTLQRNAHNTQRRSDVSHLAGIVNEYASNHAGTLPTTAQLATQLTNENFSIMTKPITVDATGNTTQDGTTSTMFIHPGVVCSPANDNTLTAANANTKSFAIMYKVETGGGSDFSCFSD